MAREINGAKVILPIWHNVNFEDVRSHSPILAGRFAAGTDKGLANVAKAVFAATGPRNHPASPIFAGRLTRRILLNLPEGSFLLSNMLNSDLTPLLAEPIPSASSREEFWRKLSSEGITKAKSYVFKDASSYRAHMVSRDIYTADGPTVAPKHSTAGTPLDFDDEVVRALIAAGKSPPAAWCPFIRSLSFEDERYNFEDLVGLKNLTELERLDLFDAKPQNIEALGKLTRLRWLYLPDSTATDIKALSDLSALEHLDINMSKVTDVRPLRNLKKLRYLHLFCRELSDISPISELDNLEFLDLSMTQVQNLSPLQSLKSLRTLVLMGTPVKDIAALSGLNELENLCLWKTKVSDLAALASLRELRTLDIDGTNVRKVAPLKNLSKLRFLNASGTDIDDLATLASNSSLETFLISEEYSGPAKIDLSESWQVWYWTRYLSVNEHHLRALIEVHGNSVVVLQRALRHEGGPS
jgi:Leucine-rich repeat (LRR) protein